MIKVILVDDEEPALQRLARMIAQHTDLQIVGSFTKPSEALAAVAALQPDAAFLDIDMPGTNGLDLAVMLAERLPLIETVMVTAFSEFAIQAFKVNAIDYLLKPVNAEDLRRCTERISRRIGVTGQTGSEPGGTRTTPGSPGSPGSPFPSSSALPFRSPSSPDQPSMPQLISPPRIVCLGGFESYAPGRSEPMRFATVKTEELFAFLLVNRDTNVSKWTLCEQIWPGHDPNKAEQNLHSTIFRLKKTCLEAGFPLELVSQRGHYRFTLARGCQCDLSDFESDAYESQRLSGEAAVAAKESAVASYKGQLFAGKTFPWCESYREGLARRYASMAKSLADHLAATGEDSRSIDTLYRLTAAVPYDEEGHEKLLEQILRKKDRSAFLQHHQRVTLLFREAFGLDPGEGVHRLYQEMKRTLR